MGKLIAIASGKGGVGKTSLTLNLAATMAAQGRKVLVFDGDFGLANIDVQLGLTPQYDLSHVLSGEVSLKESVTPAPFGFDVVPGRSGNSSLAFMTGLEQQGVLQQLRALAAEYDVCLIDVPAGLDNTVMLLCAAADRVAVVVTPDPSAITDAYALIKLLKTKQGLRNMGLVVNQGGNISESKLTGGKVAMAADKFLGLEVPVLGHILYERAYAEAVKSQHLVTQRHPNSKAVGALAALARDLLL